MYFKNFSLKIAGTPSVILLSFYPLYRILSLFIIYFYELFRRYLVDEVDIWFDFVCDYERVITCKNLFKKNI